MHLAQPFAQISRSGEPEPIAILLSALTPASTGGTDGTAKAEVAGGTEPYSYDWGNGESSVEAAGLGPGKHIVTVTDANGCTATGTLNITEDILPLATVLSLRDNVSCSGASDGAAVLEITGGKAPYTYNWSTGAAVELEHENLPAGEITVVVTDALGTESEARIVIEEPEELNVVPKILSPASTGGSDGVAEVTVSGGTEPYVYAWDNGAGEVQSSGLTPGLHSVTVTDANGCSSTISLEITEDILPLAVTLGLTNEIQCAGGTDGSATAEVTGGKGPFTFAWSAGQGSEDVADGLGTGEVAVTVTDALGTQSTASLFMDEPKPMVLDLVAVTPASTGGSDGVVRAVVTGGLEPYSYSWSGGQTLSEPNDLSAGDYQLTVTDANGCTVEGMISVAEDILPLTLSLQESVGISCEGVVDAQVQSIIGGGKGPFEYAWSNGVSGRENLDQVGPGILTLTVTDALGSTVSAEVEIIAPERLILQTNVLASATTDESDGQAEVTASGGTPPYIYHWDTGNESSTATALSPGSHGVTVTDANGCSAEAVVKITEDILPLGVSISQMAEIKCAGDATASVSVQLTGGKGPFNYKWTDPSMDVDDLEGLQTGVSVSGVAAGSYTVTVTDASGQTGTGSIVIEEPEALGVGISVVGPASTGNTDGAARVTVTGGTQPYSIEWDNGETAEEAMALAPGGHSVTIIDANGCSDFATTEITENILPLSLSMQVSDQYPCVQRRQGCGDYTRCIRG